LTNNLKLSQRITTNHEVYFHAHAMQDIPFEKLAVGMVVDLDIETGNKGPQAARVIPH